MYNDQGRIQITPITTVLVLFEIIFVIFVVITVSNLFDDKLETPKLSINNYSVIPDGTIIGESQNGISFKLDEMKKNVIESTLYDEILFNAVGNVENNGAEIREGSAYYAYISDLGIYLLNLIVDVEDLQQSYRVVYRWTNKSPNENVPTNSPVVAFCLDDVDLIYGDFDCKDEYEGLGDDTVVYGLLRNKKFDNAILNLRGDVYNGEPLVIYIYTDSDDESEKKFATREVASYLSSVGFDLERFKYVVGPNVVY